MSGFWFTLPIQHLFMDHSMLTYLNRCSQGRGAWLLLTLTALALLMAALWFQHMMGLKPCVMCIYERCALAGVMVAGVVGTIAPRTPLRWAALLIWLYSAWEGAHLSWEHTMMQLHPNPFVTCDFAASFPGWLPLDKWLPTVFVATGDCADRTWSLFSLSMPQWVVVIFATYLLVAALVLVAQFFRPRKRVIFLR